MRFFRFYFLNTHNFQYHGEKRGWKNGILRITFSILFHWIFLSSFFPLHFLLTSILFPLSVTYHHQAELDSFFTFTGMKRYSFMKRPRATWSTTMTDTTPRRGAPLSWLERGEGLRDWVIDYLFVWWIIDWLFVCLIRITNMYWMKIYR